MCNKKAARALLSLCLLSFFFSVFALFATADSHRFSSPNANVKQEYSLDDFLEEFLSVSLLQSEINYINEYSEFCFSYNSKISTRFVEVEYDESAGKLSVTAKEYKYVAENGTEVVYTPYVASLADKSHVFCKESYSFEFSEVLPTETEKLKVIYKTSFVFSEETVNGLINYVYDKAESLHNEISSYDAAYQQYNRFLELLEEYNEYTSAVKLYEAKLSEYEEYISDYEEYLELYQEYENYYVLLDKYYEDYSKYLEYQAYVEQNAALVEAYKSYQEKMERVKDQLAVIDATKKAVTPIERTVYGAVMGSTVTSVIENKDIIASQLIGADGEIVERAGTATENLRILLREYFEIKEESEKYNYYVMNYEAFRDNFAELLKTLDRLYSYSKVRALLIYEDKQEKYLILIAQLYYVATALSDAPILSVDGKYTYDQSYVIGKGYNDAVTPADALYGEEFITDTNLAKPLADGYPTPVTVPEMNEVKEPTPPVQIKKPIAPTPVQKPTPPATVEEPERVEKPVKYLPSEVERAIIQDYNDGNLIKRSAHGGELSIDITSEVEKSFINIEEVTVTYYDKEYSSKDEKNVLYTVTADKGTYADYFGPTPVKAEEIKYSYVHSGWTDGEGNDATTLNVTENISLYPKFEAKEKSFEKKWIVDGAEYSEEPTEVMRQRDNLCIYTFSGWEESIDEENLLITYTAKFDGAYIAPYGDGGLPVVEDQDALTLNLLNSNCTNPGAVDISALISLANKKTGMRLKTMKGEVFFSYSEVIALHNSNVSYFDLFAACEGSGDSGRYYYKVSLFDKNFAEVKNGVKASLTLRCDVTDTVNLSLVSTDTGNLHRYNFLDGKIKFVADTGVFYEAAVRYTVKPISTENVSIVMENTEFLFGEKTSFQLKMRPGVRLDGVYVLYSDGKKELIDSNEFEMPRDNITLIAEYTVLKYTVVFESDGKTIASYLCDYGEIITPPKNPKKASNERFSYSFIGWSNEILPVTEDTVYSALFLSVPIPRKENTGPAISEPVLKLIVTVSIVAGSVILLAAGGIITRIVVKKRRKNDKKVNTGKEE